MEPSKVKLMGLRITVASVVGTALLVGGIFWQGSVPTASLRTPMDFGAVGNGIADDTVALQKAIDATQNGGALYFPGGHKYLVRSLHATGEVHWIGPGGSWLNDRAADGAVIIQGDHANEDLLTLTNAAYSNISGIALDGNKLNQAQALNGIRLINCEFTRFDNIYVTSCSGHGILLDNTNTIQTSDEIDFVDCYSVLNALDGLHFDFKFPGGIFAPGDCEVIGGHYDFNTGAGIYLHVSAYTSINGANILSNGGAGIEAIYCTGLNIDGNMVRNNKKQGIVLGGGPTFTNCTNCLISGNQVHLNSREGAGLFANIDVGFGTANTRIIGNYAGDVNASTKDPIQSSYGIWLHDGVKNNLVVGNTCPKADNLKGSFRSEKDVSFTSLANTGFDDIRTEVIGGSMQAFTAKGSVIGTVQPSTAETIWVSISGSKGGSLNLPPLSNLRVGQNIVIKDSSGGAGPKSIVVNGNGQLIDGSASATLSTPYGILRMKFDGKAFLKW